MHSPSPSNQFDYREMSWTIRDMSAKLNELVEMKNNFKELTNAVNFMSDKYDVLIK